jgi:hypothetical protein
MSAREIERIRDEKVFAPVIVDSYDIDYVVCADRIEKSKWALRSGDQRVISVGIRE